MHHEIESVRAFHKACDVPVRDEPKGIKDEEIRLRMRLINEELRELLYALSQQDLLNIAHEGADLMYVIAGTSVQLGVTPDVTDFTRAAIETLEAVHHGIIRALQAQDWEALRTLSCAVEIIVSGIGYKLGYSSSKIFDLVHETNMSKVGPDGKVVKDAGGKVLKPEGFIPATDRIEAWILEHHPIYKEQKLQGEQP